MSDFVLLPWDNVIIAKNNIQEIFMEADSKYEDTKYRIVMILRNGHERVPYSNEPNTRRSSLFMDVDKATEMFCDLLERLQH